MDPEKDKQLCELCPILYRDRNASMQASCMGFGFECGKGWDDIIWELSLKLEAIAQKQLPPKEQNLFQKAGWFLISKVLNRIPIWKVEVPVRSWIANLPKPKPRKRWASIGEFIPYVIWEYFYPPEDTRLKAVQVKEKFGSLRFYTNMSTDEIDALIDAASLKSEQTCEECGQPGELSSNGWWITLCPTHAAARNCTSGGSEPGEA